MKNALLIALIITNKLCLIAQNSWYEIPPSQHATSFFGFELGLNRAYIQVGKRRYDSLVKSGEVNGYKFGGFASLALGNKWSLVNELIYERKGAYSEGLEVLYRLKYFSISAMPAFKHKALQIEAGPYLGYLVQATDDIPDNVIKIGAMTSENFNTFDGGMRMGVGITVLKKFIVCFNYDHGVLSVYDYPEYGASGHLERYSHHKTRSFSISIRSAFKQFQLRMK